MSMGFLSLFFIFNLMDPGASLRHYKMPDWLATMKQPALQSMCLNRSAAIDKRILAAAALRMKYRGKTDFRTLADNVADPVLKRDLLSAGGRKPGKKPSIGLDGIPDDILSLPADTKAVLFYSGHLQKKNDIPEISKIKLLQPFNRYAEIRYFNTLRTMSWLRLDSLTIGVAGVSPEIKSGKVNLTVLGIARGTFNGKKIRSHFRKIKAETAIINGEIFYLREKLALHFHDKNTIIAAVGLHREHILKRLAALKISLRDGNRPLKGNGMSRLLAGTFRENPFFSLTVKSENLIREWMLQDMKTKTLRLLKNSRALRMCLYNASTFRFRIEGEFENREALDRTRSRVNAFLSKQQILAKRILQKAADHAADFRLPQFHAFLKGIQVEREGLSLNIRSSAPLNINTAFFLTFSGPYIPIMIKMSKRKRNTVK